MAFTTWAAFLQEVLDDLRSGAWRTKSYNDSQGHVMVYQNLGEYQAFVTWVQRQAAAEGVGIAINLAGYRRVS
jgi:hypothetical protein